MLVATIGKYATELLSIMLIGSGPPPPKIHNDIAISTFFKINGHSPLMSPAADTVKKSSSMPQAIEKLGIVARNPLLKLVMQLLYFLKGEAINNYNYLIVLMRERGLDTVINDSENFTQKDRQDFWKLAEELKTTPPFIPKESEIMMRDLVMPEVFDKQFYQNLEVSHQKFDQISRLCGPASEFIINGGDPNEAAQKWNINDPLLKNRLVKLSEEINGKKVPPNDNLTPLSERLSFFKRTIKKVRKSFTLIFSRAKTFFFSIPKIFKILIIFFKAILIIPQTK